MVSCGHTFFAPDHRAFDYLSCRAQVAFERLETNGFSMTISDTWLCKANEQLTQLSEEGSPATTHITDDKPVQDNVVLSPFA